MAIEINTRTKILAGVVVLAAAGAGAWFFLLQEEPPPTPPPAAKAPAKPAAEAPKGAPAPAAAAKAPADAAKAAAAPKGPPKPVPTDPAQVVAAIVEETGLKAAVSQLSKDMKQLSAQYKDPAAAKEIESAVEKIWEPGTILAELSEALRSNYDSNRMPRFLDLLRQPVVQKMTELGVKSMPSSMQDVKAQVAYGEKNPPSEARGKLIARIEQMFRPLAGVDGGVEIATIEGMLEQLHTDKRANALLTAMGDGNARNARTALIAKVNDARNKRIRDEVNSTVYTYRDASDEDLAEYVKLMDTEIGEWGIGATAGILQPAFQKRARETGRVAGKLMLAAPAASVAAPAKEKPVAEAPAEKLAVATPKPPAAAKEAPAYQRPANIREAFTRYNDLMTATVMRDRVAVKELLDGGKNPNARQSDGKTALMIAAGNGDSDLVQMLLAKGADPNLRAAGGITALSTAREARRGDVAQLLERSGAKN